MKSTKQLVEEQNDRVLTMALRYTLDAKAIMAGLRGAITQIDFGLDSKDMDVDNISLKATMAARIEEAYRALLEVESSLENRVSVIDAVGAAKDVVDKYANGYQ